MEENLMMEQQDSVFTAYHDIPYFLLDSEIGENRRAYLTQEMSRIAWLYKVYKEGSEFVTEGSNNDYEPSRLKFKKAAMIMNKEARFLFSNPPTFNVNRDDVSSKYAEQNAKVQNFLDKVLERNNFNGNLLKALKDCFIGKRIAIVLNVNDDDGITVTFLNSLEFVYDIDRGGDGKLTKFVSFYLVEDQERLADQRWFKKKYTLEDDGVYLVEEIWSGTEDLIETVTPRMKIRFDYIPVTIVFNDGLTGDDRGCSELEDLIGCEEYYSRLSNADFDALRKSMNPTRYTVDASQNSTKDLSTSPGSYWDIQSDDEKTEEKVAKVGMLEAGMNYSGPLKTTLDRVENQMYNSVDVPNITSDQLAGVITSGKTIQALYWGLTVRCDEKMLAWGHSLKFIARAIIESAHLYPQYVDRYVDNKESIPDIPINIVVENNYPIPEDTNEEKAVDLNEVEMKVRSKKSYIKKWQKLNDKDADLELDQIKREQDMFESSVAASYSGTVGGNQNKNGDSDGEAEEGKGDAGNQDAQEGQEQGSQKDEK